MTERNTKQSLVVEFTYSELIDKIRTGTRKSNHMDESISGDRHFTGSLLPLEQCLTSQQQQRECQTT